MEKGERVEQARSQEREQNEPCRHQERGKPLFPSEPTGTAMRNQVRRTEALLEQTR
jgi:hypothetical protein